LTDVEERGEERGIRIGREDERRRSESIIADKDAALADKDAEIARLRARLS
jgi:hypothetical protein